MDKNYSIIGILVIMGLIVAISGCTSSGTNTQIQQFNGKQMSFQYLQGWNIQEYNSGYSVTLLKGSEQIGVTKKYTKHGYQTYLNDAASTYTSLGKFTEGNITYNKYDAGSDYAYALTKNGKYFTVYGPKIAESNMLEIIKTIN
ncbi:hypothetical protein [Methanobacterium sp.]|uniref:hypothetical protein n=1 Tax=Methanobacterium sp. TaxID=2164 RepID=UPI003C748B85